MNSLGVGTTRDLFQEMGWKVLYSQPTKSTFAPFGFHLLRQLKNRLRGNVFRNNEEVNEDANRSFRDQPKESFAKGIRKVSSTGGINVIV